MLKDVFLERQRHSVHIEMLKMVISAHPGLGCYMDGGSAKQYCYSDCHC